MKKTHFCKSVALALTLAMSLSLAACGGTPSETTLPASTAAPVETTAATTPAADPTLNTSAPETQPATQPASSPDLDQLRENLEPSAAIAAIFYVGYHEGEPMDSGFLHMLATRGYSDRYPFMSEIPLDHYVRTAGCDVFCIVPADPNSTVTVTEWDESVSGTAGKVLYTSTSGEPIFVQGNISDIMPNLAVTIVNSYGHTLSQYHPFISLRDGTVMPSDDDQAFVMDLTAYGPDNEDPDTEAPDGIPMSFDLYYPDSDFSHMTFSTIQYADLNEFILLQLLIDYGAVPDSVFIHSFASGNDDLKLDLNKEFQDYLDFLIDADQQEMVLGSVVNSFLCAYGCSSITLTADGLPIFVNGMETRNPMTFFND